MLYNPKISIVTPSFNQSKYLEQTICSVINQDYPNYEYFIFDGGSTEGSVEIIKKYENKITYWESNKDNGQADAIYRGFDKATGEIICWLNSDDIFLKDTLKKVGEYFVKNTNEICLIGSTIIIDENGNKINKLNFIPSFSVGSKISFNHLLFYDTNFNQPSTFFRKSSFYKVGGFDKNLKFAFDRDLYFRLSTVKKLGFTRTFLSAFRLHSKSKTFNEFDICKIEVEYLRKENGFLKYNIFVKMFYKIIYILKNYLTKSTFLIFNYDKIKKIKFNDFK